MKNIYSSVACGGMDVHYKFSAVTFRDETGRVVRRERIEHPQRDRRWEHLNRWPRGLPIVLEASFGWGWLSDLLSEAGLEPHLSNCYLVKVCIKTEEKEKRKKCYLTVGSLSWIGWALAHVVPITQSLSPACAHLISVGGLRTSLIPLL